MSNVLYPPNYPSGKRRPVVFLAGPIQQAPEWQEEAASLIKGKVPYPEEYVIACPRNKGVWHGDYNAQVEWEDTMLFWSRDDGMVLFWLCNPDPNQERSQERSYAQTTRFELGEFFGRMMAGEKINLFLGIEPGFHNERYISHKFRGHPIYTNLQSLCEAAASSLESMVLYE
jgi:hypothetical protein